MTQATPQFLDFFFQILPLGLRVICKFSKLELFASNAINLGENCPIWYSATCLQLSERGKITGERTACCKIVKKGLRSIHTKTCGWSYVPCPYMYGSKIATGLDSLNIYTSKLIVSTFGLL